MGPKSLFNQSGPSISLYYVRVHGLVSGFLELIIPKCEGIRAVQGSVLETSVFLIKPSGFMRH